jgi:hypothetical protein
MTQTVTVYYSTVIVLLSTQSIILKISIAWVKSFVVFQPCLFHLKPYITASIAPAPVAK